jgi:hypothetical protein
MSTTQTNEALYWQHIEDDDLEGAKQYLPTPAGQLRESADKYLNDAVESGEVILSRIFMMHHLGKFVGYTTVETHSGVTILKNSDGVFDISASYEERLLESEPGDYQDLKVQVELPKSGEPVVREDRRRIVGHERTGEGGNRTLSRSGSERVMGELTKLIWQVF